MGMHLDLQVADRREIPNAFEDREGPHHPQRVSESDALGAGRLGCLRHLPEARGNGPGGVLGTDADRKPQVLLRRDRAPNLLERPVPVLPQLVGELLVRHRDGEIHQVHP